MKVGSIVVKCKKFDEMLAFWQAALHYVPIGPPKDGWVIQRDPEGRGPNLSLDKALDDERVGSTGCPRLHLDLYADDQEGEVNRLLGIGQLAIHRRMTLRMTSLFWKTLTATSSAWSRPSANEKIARANDGEPNHPDRAQNAGYA